MSSASAATQVRKPTVVVRSGSRSDTGRVRNHNEDSFLVVDLTTDVDNGAKATRLSSGGVLMCVCDGMGGAAAGEVASGIAVQAIRACLTRVPASLRGDELAWALVDTLEGANQAVRADAEKHRERRGMGTTATVAVVRADQLWVAQVGDSRAYVLRNGKLVQITKDQSLANQLVELGAIGEAEVENFPSNSILQALGVVEALEVQLWRVALRRGDRVLVCSDGLSGSVADFVIEQVAATYEKMQAACERLVELANHAGGKDNITVAMCELDGDGLAPPDPEEVARPEAYALPERTADAPRFTPAMRSSTVDDGPITLPPHRAARWRWGLLALLLVLLLGHWAWPAGELGVGDAAEAGAREDVEGVGKVEGPERGALAPSPRTAPTIAANGRDEKDVVDRTGAGPTMPPPEGKAESRSPGSEDVERELPSDWHGGPPGGADDHAAFVERQDEPAPGRARRKRRPPSSKRARREEATGSQAKDWLPPAPLADPFE